MAGTTGSFALSSATNPPTQCVYDSKMGQTLCFCAPGDTCDLTKQQVIKKQDGMDAPFGHYMLCIGGNCTVAKDTWVDCIDGAKCKAGSNAVADCIHSNAGDGGQETSCTSEEGAENTSLICRPGTQCAVTTPENDGVTIYCKRRPGHDDAGSEGCVYSPSGYTKVKTRTAPLPEAFYREHIQSVRKTPAVQGWMKKYSDS